MAAAWSTRRLVVALLPLAALALGMACESLGGPNDVQSIQFDSSLQVYPSIVEGEQLRDSNGIVQSLVANAFNGSGKKIEGATFTFLSFDTLLKVTSAGSVMALGYRDTPAKIYVTAGGLQSNPLNLILTHRPDTLSLVSASVPDVRPQIGLAQDTITVLLRNVDTTNTLQAVPSWIVGWRVEHNGSALSPTDTTVAWLTSPEAYQSGVFKPFAYDTSGVDGRAQRILIVHTSTLAKPLDSLVVFASARYHGAPVKGSPLRVVVRIQQ